MEITPFLIKGERLINPKDYDAIVFHCSHDGIQQDKTYKLFAQTEGDDPNVPQSFVLHAYSFEIVPDNILAIKAELDAYWAKDKKGPLSHLSVVKKTGSELLKPEDLYTIRFLVPKEGIKPERLYKVWLDVQPDAGASYLQTVHMYESVPVRIIEILKEYDKYMAPMDFQV